MQYPVQKTGVSKNNIQGTQETILVDLNAKQVVAQESKGKTASQSISSANLANTGLDETTITQNLKYRKQDAFAAWNKVDKFSTSPSAATRESATAYDLYKTISDVPMFYWTHGCSPTSAAMVLGTWRNRGLTNLPADDGINADRKPSGDPLNQALATAMGTDTVFGQDGWTWPWMIAFGINRVMAVDSGYPYTSSSAVNTAYSWPAIQSEIDANRPFELSMFNVSVNPLSFWGHSYAAVGYGYDSWGSIKYIEVYTTWKDDPHKYLTFGSWEGSMNTFVRPDQTFTITSTAAPGGSISPAGSVATPVDTTPEYTITPNPGFVISQVMVDSASVGAVSSYQFAPVTASHTIGASFNPVITASAGSGGTITPSGSVTVPYGTNQTFTIAPSSGYEISDVLIDNSSVGIINNYTFSSVTLPHTISATFKQTAGTIGVGRPGIFLTKADRFENYQVPFSLTDCTNVPISWDGTGHVILYHQLSDGTADIMGADDELTVSTQHASRHFSIGGGWPQYSGQPDITSIMQPGINYLTLVTQDNGGGWCGLNEDVWIKAQNSASTLASPIKTMVFQNRTHNQSAAPDNVSENITTT